MKTFEQGLGFLIDDYSHNSSVVEFFYINYSYEKVGFFFCIGFFCRI